MLPMPSSRTACAMIGLAALVVIPAQSHPSRRPAPSSETAETRSPSETGSPIAIDIDDRPSQALNRFRPDEAFGAGVDGVPFPAVPEIYRPGTVRQMLAAGLGPVSYRLYTELSVQDWHWNPAGTFSRPGGQGYWTSSSTLGQPTINTFGYRLPRRGDTHDQGNDDSFSRLDDGDPLTFWKSNPYLARPFTHESDALHPQWVLVDLNQAVPVDAARIVWASPYAMRYAVQYWTGGDPIYDPAHGAWVDFPRGAVGQGTGGTTMLDLGRPQGPVRYVRVLMSESSGTCAGAGQDSRDCAGYAIAEIGLGTLDASGHFTDLVRHSPDQRQTTTYASSTDPWHAATDRVRNQEQPGLDTVFGSGITGGLPATVPIPMLYSTPDNAAAEIAYLEARGDRIARVEMGEEPDGEYVTPEDDAALYIQFAEAVHAVDPKLVLGGPVFQSNLSDVKAWPDASGETSWTKRFLAYLRTHGHIGDFGFFSFEHYPFAACGSDRTQANLLREPGLVRHIVDSWRDDGLPPNTPIFITETNYSQNETDAAQQPAGALWLADMFGSLLSAGGAGAFFYEYEPIPLSRSNPCPGWGSYGLLEGDGHYRPTAKVSQFAAAHLLSTVWVQPGHAVHTLYPASTGADWVTAYPVQRPDGSWGVLLVNRDLAAAHDVTLAFGGSRHLAGPVVQSSFGAAQYGWIEAGRHSHPAPDEPASTTHVQGGAGTLYHLPRASVTILDGRVE